MALNSALSHQREKIGTVMIPHAPRGSGIISRSLETVDNGTSVSVPALRFRILPSEDSVTRSL
jgi:hypothetical protein